MLTPVEIQNKSFKSVGLGYDKKDVDSYMKEILRSYEDAYRENMELKDKVAVLNEGIQHYKTIEKTLNKALILAEKTAEETRNAASKEAKRIEKEATAKANILLADARNELNSLHQQTVALVQQYEKYRLQFKNLAHAQIEMLESEAFSLNIQNLEAFTANASVEGIKAEFNSNNDSAPAKSEEVSEIVSDIKGTSSSGHLSDSDDGEYEFSDYDLEGQEEFDFVDLNDSN